MSFWSSANTSDSSSFESDKTQVEKASLWDLAHSQTGDGFGNWLMESYPESVYLDYVRYDTNRLSFNLVFLVSTDGDKVAGFMLVPNDTLRTFTEIVFTFPAKTFESSLTLVDAMCQGAEPAGSAATVLRASDAISALKESRQPAVEEAEAADETEATAEADEAEAESADATDEAGADEAEEAEVGALTDGKYTDGTYEGTGKGIGGDVPVTVTVEGGKIASVEVGDNSETQGIGSNAIEQLPELIVEANGTEGVDGVSGATITSNAIFTAVDEALSSAASGDADATAETEADAATEETTEDEAAADEAGATEETEAGAEAGAAADEAGATDAAADADATEEADEAGAEAGAEAEAAAGSYADGTYEGTGKGIGGDVPVTVTVEGGKIASVEVGDNSETQGIGTNAIEQLPALIVEAGGTEGVEGVSGATVTSNAILDAVETALEGASR